MGGMRGGILVGRASLGEADEDRPASRLVSSLAPPTARKGLRALPRVWFQDPRTTRQRFPALNQNAPR